MAAGKYTTPSSASCEIHDATAPALELNLPEAEGRSSLPPLVPLEQMIRRSRQLREWFPSGVRSAEERWQNKTDVDFRL